MTRLVEVSCSIWWKGWASTIYGYNGLKQVCVEYESFDVSNPHGAWRYDALWFGFILGCLESLLILVLNPTQGLIKHI